MFKKSTFPYGTDIAAEYSVITMNVYHAFYTSMFVQTSVHSYYALILIAIDIAGNLYGNYKLWYNVREAIGTLRYSKLLYLAQYVVLGEFIQFHFPLLYGMSITRLLPSPNSNTCMCV